MSDIVTEGSLQYRSLPELRAAFAKAQRELVKTDAGTEARREALANLEEISRTIAARMAAP